MGITYDEVFISTRREIKICQDIIKIYEKNLREFEESLQIKASEIKEDMLKNKRIRKLYETKLALEKQKERLKGLEELLK